MQPKTDLKILVVEDNPGDLLLIREFLELAQIGQMVIFVAETLSGAQKVIDNNTVDIIFLDLFLPDSQGLETFDRITQISHAIPVIVISGLSDLDTAIKSIQNGAQDYLLKGEIDEKILTKTIFYSIERQKIQKTLNESLEMHELISRATNDVIWDWDLKQNSIVPLSHAMETFFGYNDFDVKHDFDWWFGKIHPHDIENVQYAIWESFKSKLPKAAFEFRFQDGTGAYREVLVRALLLRRINDIASLPYRVVGAMQDITDLKVLKSQVLQNEISTQRLITEATIDSQEKEREGLGKELHDNINQILTTSKMFIDIAIKNPGMREELLPQSLQHLATAIEELRKLSKSLVPPSLGDLGLEDAIRELLETVAMVSEVKYVFECGKINRLLPPNVQLMAYRIVQEQVNNIFKYAKATMVSVRIWFEEQLMHLRIADDGIGFDVKSVSNGIGLRNIRSRVEVHHGTVTINSSPGHGCTLELSIPF